MEENHQAELRQRDVDMSRLEEQLAQCHIQQNIPVSIFYPILAKNVVVTNTDLIGYSEVSISHRNLQVFIETYKFS